LELGLYDPLTGDRWPTMKGDGQPGLDHLSISVGGKP